MSERNCAACAYSGIEPDDMDLTCHHAQARQPFGEHVIRGPIAPCGPERVLFEQHPRRSASGELSPLLSPCSGQDGPRATLPPAMKCPVSGWPCYLPACVEPLRCERLATEGPGVGTEATRGAKNG